MQTTLPASSFAAALMSSMSCLVLPEPLTPIISLTIIDHYNIRLIDAQEYDLHSYEVFRGFISGLYAGNYDISQVFIDNLCKTVGTDVDAETEKFLNWLDVFGERNNIKFTVTISGDVETATDGMRKYL